VKEKKERNKERKKERKKEIQKLHLVLPWHRSWQSWNEGTSDMALTEVPVM
jgi:hypothetical protein